MTSPPAPYCYGLKSQIPTLVSKLLPNLAPFSLHTLGNLTIPLYNHHFFLSVSFSSCCLPPLFQMSKSYKPFRTQFIATCSLKPLETLPISIAPTLNSRPLCLFWDTHPSPLGSCVHAFLPLRVCCKTRVCLILYPMAGRREGSKRKKEGLWLVPWHLSSPNALSSPLTNLVPVFLPP